MRRNKRYRERYFVAEILRRFLGPKYEPICADIEAYAEGRMDYDGFKASRTYWKNNPPDKVPHRAVEHAFHREATLAVSMVPLSIQYDHETQYVYNHTVKTALSHCQFSKPVARLPRNETTVKLAQTIHDTRDFGLMPLLYDALLDAGVNHQHCLNRHHGRGCFILEGLLCP